MTEKKLPDKEKDTLAVSGESVAEEDGGKKAVEQETYGEEKEQEEQEKPEGKGKQEEQEQLEGQEK